MSRSYRYNPDEDSAELTPAKRRRARRVKDEATAHPPMSEEWAMELLKPHVVASLKSLADRNIIASYEIEDYTQILNVHICRMLPLYDEEHVGESGKSASVEWYLKVAVNSAVTDIVRLAMSRKSHLPMVPMPELHDDEDRESERKCSDNHWVSDGCRSVRDLWFRMDVAVLSEMLTPEERITTNLRVQGYTYPEIAEAVTRILGVTVDRFHIMNVTMERVRKAARKCGFVPYSEMRTENS